MDVPEELVSRVENLVAARGSERGGSWYALTSFGQAVMTLVWLAKDAGYEQLAADFGVAVGALVFLGAARSGCTHGLSAARETRMSI